LRERERETFKCKRPYGAKCRWDSQTKIGGILKKLNKRNFVVDVRETRELDAII